MRIGDGSAPPGRPPAAAGIRPVVSRPLPPFAAADPADVAAVRDVLRASGFDGQTVADTVRVEGDAPPAARQLPLLLRLTSAGRPVDVLIRLFVVGTAVDREVAEAALAPTPLELWERLGLVGIDGGRVRPAVMLRPWDDLLVASDRTQRGSGGLPGDFVMGVSVSSVLLGRLTVREAVDEALDIGTGCGFQALLAARHAARVTVTDVNPRALAYARLNAALNGLEFEVVEGSLYEPVAGRRFGLIVSNAPYVIAPEPTHHFLHAGLADDGVGRVLASGAADHLEPGGYCQFLCNWLMPGEEWIERLGSWFDDCGCEVWLMRASSTPVEQYAAKWIEVADTETELVPAFDAWMDYFAGLGVQKVGTGLVTMQRSTDGGSRLHLEDGPNPVTDVWGADVARGLRLRARLATMDDDAVLATRPRLADAVQLRQELTPKGGGWVVAAQHVRRTSGFPYHAGVDRFGATLLGRCDGSRTLRELLAELAAELEESVDDVIGTSLPTLRRMFEQEFLELS